MMSSYHYNYYYCYDYYDYPSYCCCSVLLNVFFLSLDDLLHLETSLIFSVPQKDFSNGKTKQNKTTPVSAICTCLRTHIYPLLQRLLFSLTGDFTNVAQ